MAQICQWKWLPAGGFIEKLRNLDILTITNRHDCGADLERVAFMPIPYTPLAIANEFINIAGQSGGVEHMKLQKLVYCSYGWWLASKGMGAPRLTTEGPQIWKHGPVFDSLYHALKVFGHRPIETPQAATPFSQVERVDKRDTITLNFINWIWSRYGHLSGFALSDMTHKPGTPWHRVATENNFSVRHNTLIPDLYIFEEFSGLMKGMHAAAGAQGDGVNEPEQRPVNA